MTDKIMIEALAGGIKDGDLNIEEGGRAPVTAEKAQLYCEMGWAKAVDGSIETKDPVPGSVTVSPSNVEQKG